jgi:hypothetical protein
LALVLIEKKKNDDTVHRFICCDIHFVSWCMGRSFYVQIVVAAVRGFLPSVEIFRS